MESRPQPVFLLTQMGYFSGSARAAGDLSSTSEAAVLMGQPGAASSPRSIAASPYFAG